MKKAARSSTRVARWGGVLLGALLAACGPVPEDGPGAKDTTVPEPALEEALPLPPDAKPVDVREASSRSSGVSNPFDISRPSLQVQPTGFASVGVAFDGKQYLVVWQDERTGGVFGARVKPNGRILDPAGFPINSLNPISAQNPALQGGEPRVAWDGRQFVVVWATLNGGVFGAHVESDGHVRRHFILASSTEVFGPPGIACANRLCLVAFDTSGGEAASVIASRVTSDGDVLGGVTISSLTGSARFPSVAWDGKQFLVVWQDERGGGPDGYDIYGARVKKDGTVVDPGGRPLVMLPGAQRFADVTWTGDHFLVVWEDDRFGTPDIFGARFRRDLTRDATTDIAISAGPGAQTAPHVASSGSRSLVVWDDTRLGPHRARGARVGDDGSVLDPAGFTLSSGDEDEERRPDVAAGDQQFFVAFAGAGMESGEINRQHILGTRVQHDTTVKDSPALRFTRSAYAQRTPAAAAGAGSSLVVWSEEREGTTRLLATRVRPDGRVLDVPLTLPAGPNAGNPSVAWNGDMWLVVWEDNLTDANLLGARVSRSGVLLDPVSIPIATSPNSESEPSVASNGDDFLVVWTNRGSGDEDVFGARVGSGGTVLDPGGFLISPAGPFEQQNPAVVGTGGLGYFVAWVHIDFFSSETIELSVRGARVDADGRVLDTPEILISESPTLTPPALAWDGTNTLVAWPTLEPILFGPGRDVLAARVDAGGQVLDTPPIVVATSSDRLRTEVTATFDGKDFWLAWVQSGTPESFPALDFPTDVYGARVRTNGTVRDPGGGRAIATHQPEPETEPVLVSAGGGRVNVFYTEFITDDEVMNLRIQGRVLTGLGPSRLEVGVPEPAAAR
jgi:hypothetical protein